ncbi:MAG TPA: CHRD domain-containing protein, partial [Candidatus Udaeobacter sp.]|nr:CHRD domain-containing protein [Candidatus Udaeobacter sp.]
MRTKTLTPLLVAATMTFVLAGAALALPHATAKMTGAQEVPPVVTNATGTAAIRLNETRTALTYDITVNGLSGPITLAHFHRGAVGVAGPVVKTITGSFSGSTATGVWRDTDAEPLTPALVAEIMAGNIYVNVHTTLNGGGEIRG